MFTQVLDPLGSLTLTCLAALVPVVSLLVLLAAGRSPASAPWLTSVDRHCRLDRPWSPLPRITWFIAQVTACVGHAAACQAAKPDATAAFTFAPYVGGTAILTSWIIVALLLLAFGRLTAAQLGEVFRRTWRQMWGARLVGIFIQALRAGNLVVYGEEEARWRSLSNLYSRWFQRRKPTANQA